MRLRWLMPLALLAASPLVAQEIPGDDAVAAIALPEEQLRGLLARVIFGTQTTLMAAEAMGIEPFCAATLPAVDKAVEAHLPAWRANLVQAYRDTVPSDVLAAATAEAPDVARATLKPHIDAIGGAMHKASSPLLKQAAGEILASLQEAAKPYDIKTIDMEKRRAELKAGAADGTTFCGLLGRPQPKSS